MEDNKKDLRMSLSSSLGESIQDVDEEVFSLFSQSIPSHDLGFVDSKADLVQVNIAGHDYQVMQSPGLLHAPRKGGTTGAVLWMISPVVARWLVSDQNLLWREGILNKGAIVVELGCGIAGVIALSLYGMIDTYVLTDQEYVRKRLQANIDANVKIASQRALQQSTRLKIATLDWEADAASNIRNVLSKDAAIDLVIACDCIYNEFLIRPFVETCVDVCKLSENKRTLLLVAQQLRSDDVFSQWLTASLEHFDVWRVSDDQLSHELVSGSGFAVHLLLLRTAA